MKILHVLETLSPDALRSPRPPAGGAGEGLQEGQFDCQRIRAILHNGACSNTLEDDGEYMMDNNFTYSKEVLHFAVIPY